MTALTDDIPTITNTLVTLPLLGINIAVVLGGLVYLGWLSPLTLLAVLGFMVIGIVTYQLPLNQAVKSFRLAREDADQLFNHFRALTNGTKELKLHQRRRDSFLGSVLRKTAASLREKNVKGMTIYTAASSWGQVLVFIVVGLVLFALPLFSVVQTETSLGYVITLLYLMTPLQLIMNATPAISRASIALKKVEELGLTLGARGTEKDAKELPNAITDLEIVELEDVTHAYYREGENASFTLGPINLTITPGEMIFLAGGNGSGKTTLAKLICGLYLPETGIIRLNDEVVTEDTRELYRQHFSMVFSDFFLFESLLGLEQPNLDEHAQQYLKQLQLDHKVEIKDGRLSTTDLSQGQRKRLALLTAYLEDRPIYIFDEWAADQDPIFKEVFYYQILADLKASGKTVLVITHDDRYYHVADRIIKLDYGKIVTDQMVISELPALFEEPVALKS